MADLAKLVVKLEAQTAEFENRLKAAEKFFKKTHKNFSTIASNAALELASKIANAASSFVGFGKAAVDAAAQMQDMAQRTGVSTEALSQLDYAAQQSGTSMETLEKSLAKLSKAQAAAVGGSKQAAESFAKIGVSVKNADGSLRSTEEVLLDVAERFSKLQDGAAKAALAQELFGKSGTELIPLLNKGREGITALTKEADKLGLTIGGKTAAAASAFNDNLNKMRNVTRGIASQFVTQVLPMLGSLAEEFLSAAQRSGTLEAAVGTLVIAFKTLLTAGTIVQSIFSQLGRIIYGVGAAVVRIAQGEFKLAAEEIADAFAKARDKSADTMGTVAKIWSKSVDSVRETAAAQNNALKDSILFNADKASEEARNAAAAALESLKKISDGLKQQVETYGMAEGAVIRYRIAQGDLADEVAKAGPAAQQYTDNIITMTDEMERLKAQTEEADQKQKEWNAAADEGKKIAEQMRTPVEEWADSIQRLTQLLADGHITQETFNRAVEAAQETLDKASKEQNKFLEQANRNIQDILGKGIENIMTDGAKKGAKGMLEAFDQMLRQMIAQAIAAQIAKKIFGEEGLGSGQGLFGKIIGGFGELFGKSRDSGGRGRAGQAYMIGTGAQPEMFIPDTAGEFLPANQWMGGGQRVTQNIYVQGRVDLRSARQLELEASRRQNSARARLG